MDVANWPPKSLDINRCHFSVRGQIKDKVYSLKLDTVKQLTENIEREFKIFKKTDLKSFFLSQKRTTLLKEQNGGYFKHILKIIFLNKNFSMSIIQNKKNLFNQFIFFAFIYLIFVQ